MKQGETSGHALEESSGRNGCGSSGRCTCFDPRKNRLLCPPSLPGCHQTACKAHAKRRLRDWRTWQDLNPQPLDPKSSALSIELQVLKESIAQKSRVGSGSPFNWLASAADVSLSALHPYDRQPPVLSRPLHLSRDDLSQGGPWSPGHTASHVRPGQRKR